MPQITFVPLAKSQPQSEPAIDTSGELHAYLHGVCGSLDLVSMSIHVVADDGFGDRLVPAMSLVRDEQRKWLHDAVEAQVLMRARSFVTVAENSWLAQCSACDNEAGHAVIRRGRDYSGSVFLFTACASRVLDTADVSELMRAVDKLLHLPLLRITAQAANRRTRPGQQLSARERECLTWTAEGKTSEEIAIILHLSAHTVNHYLKSAATKLNAVNRLQAVARAIRLGLLMELDATSYSLPPKPAEALSETRAELSSELHRHDPRDCRMGRDAS